jgi:hypothetical protein
VGRSGFDSAFPAEADEFVADVAMTVAPLPTPQKVAAFVRIGIWAKRLLGGGSVADQGFRSFRALKRALGPAGADKHWHHIVEQTKKNVARFGPETIHNTRNVVAIDAKVHRQVSGYYSSKDFFTGGKTVRQWLKQQSFELQEQFGKETLLKFGVTP